MTTPTCNGTSCDHATLVEYYAAHPDMRPIGAAYQEPNDVARERLAARNAEITRLVRERGEMRAEIDPYVRCIERNMEHARKITEERDAARTAEGEAMLVVEQQARDLSRLVADRLALREACDQALVWLEESGQPMPRANDEGLNEMMRVLIAALERSGR